MSVTVMEPVRVPAAAGLNVTVIEQVAFGAIEPVQALVSAKSSLAATLVMLRLAVPLLVTVTVWVGLLVPTT